jgi:probable phosphoglycerate mutase
VYSLGLTLYLLRHGQTEASRDNLMSGSGLDPELTADGLAMADAFAECYRAVQWNAIYSSPMRRALMTAAPLARATGLHVETRDGLKEIGFGAWEGIPLDTLKREQPDAYARWSSDPAWFPPPGGETAITVARRALDVIEEIRGRFAGGNILVVAHKATIRILLCSLLGIDVGRYRFRLACPVASVSIVEFGSEGPRLDVLADRSHLDARLRNLPGT